jgi:ketosteroid isomerase-like protein
MMLGNLFSFALVLLAAVPARAANPAEEVLRGLDARLQLAVLEQDTKTLELLLSDDWLLITASGRVVTRPAFLALVSDPGSRLAVNESSDVNVRLHGATAIVTAKLHEAGTDHGKPYDAWLRFTDTWVLESGAWRYVSGHACAIKPPEKAP